MRDSELQPGRMPLRPEAWFVFMRRHGRPAATGHQSSELTVPPWSTSSPGWPLVALARKWTERRFGAFSASICPTASVRGACSAEK